MPEQYRIEAQSLDWVEIITALVAREVKAKGIKEPPVQIMPTPLGVTYMIDKSFLTADAIAKVIGSTAEAVAAAKRITLSPSSKQADWEKPTVEYVGHA